MRRYFAKTVMAALCLALAGCVSTPRLAIDNWSGLPLGDNPVRVSTFRTDTAVGVIFQPARRAGAPTTIGNLLSELCRPQGEPEALFTDCLPYFLPTLRERFPQEDLEGITQTAMVSTFDAAPLPGRRPLVVLMGSPSGRGMDLIAMAESVASHGYVVAVAGLAEPTGETSPSPTLFAQLRRAHLETIQALRADPGVDEDRIAVGGWSIGGCPGALYAMNDPNVRAIISLDDAVIYQYGVDLIRAADGYNPQAYRGGLLLISAGVENSVPKSRALVDALSGAARREAVAPTLVHGSFSDQFGSLPALIAPPSERREFHRAHAEVAATTIAFLDEHVR